MRPAPNDKNLLDRKRSADFDSAYPTDLRCQQPIIVGLSRLAVPRGYMSPAQIVLTVIRTRLERQVYAAGGILCAHFPGSLEACGYRRRGS